MSESYQESIVDHVAVQTSELDADVDLFCRALGYEVVRRGVNVATDGAIAILEGPDRFRLELISMPSPRPGHSHLAFRVEDLIEECDRLHRAGFRVERRPFAVGDAKADSAFLASPGGIRVQLIRYDRDSPDLVKVHSNFKHGSNSFTEGVTRPG